MSFPSSIAVAKTSKTMLNNSGESGHSCLILDFRGNAFNFSPLRIMFAVGLSYCWAYTPRKPELKETHVPQCSLQHCL